LWRTRSSGCPDLYGCHPALARTPF
jgi:hypothetical protein